MTREQGIEMVKKYCMLAPKNLSLFLDWIGMTENGFNYIIDQHRNKKLWRRNDNWEWELTMPVIPAHDASFNSAALPALESWKDFVITPPKRSTDKKDDYILIGKGYYA